jgi:cytochrome c peroxidase
MKHFTSAALLLVVVLAFSSCAKEDMNGASQADQLIELLRNVSPTGGIDHFRLPHEQVFVKIPQDPYNPLTNQKVELGKLLFHETGIALAPLHTESKGTYSCASCHHAGAGFQAGRWQAIADGGSGFGLNGEGRVPMLSIYEGDELDVQPVRSPTAMNGAYQEVMLWNGQFGAEGVNAGTESYWPAGTPIETNFLGYHGLETQAIAALTVHRMVINETVVDTLGYKALFDEAFPDFPVEDRYGKETAGLAIAAYERTLLANQAPFQEFLKGKRYAMSSQEIEGALLFFDPNKGNCVSCHSGPALSSMSFHALGMKDLHQIPEQVFQASDTVPANLGRGSFTGEADDMYKFKTPQLYNLADSPFFGHGSSFRSIREVLVYKNNGVQENLAVPTSQLASEFYPLNLSEEEIDALTEFLTTGLYDPNLFRYVPDELPSGNCFPNNDELARVHLGCE